MLAKIPHHVWARRLAERLAEEAGLVAEARGVRLPGDPVREALRVAEATRSNVSSMAQDLRRGARTEVDYINGAVTSAGRELGVPTPYNEAVYLAVKALEAVARSSYR
ncbi:MAG: hypothetical protein JZD41_06775 [Thermoproteus sp.]|nr:hypothetical protein [Thermoproteus sp.]